MKGTSALVWLLNMVCAEAFQHASFRTHQALFSSKSMDEVQATETSSNEVARLKAELFELADSTKRGFKATQDDRKRASRVIDQLEKMNPTSEPASPYYPDPTYIPGPNVCGKWTLIYTDAPDITSLGRTSPTAQLGRIGQECNPPYVKNVIEWKRPEWAAALPFSGTSESRILQKVCTKAKAVPDDPQTLDLQIAGFELVTGPETEDSGSNSLLDSITNQGLPAGLLQQNPVSLEGSLTLPFGKAKILYLDENLRILRTNQNFVAVNMRSDPVWF